MKKLLISSVLVLSVGFISGCSYKNSCQSNSCGKVVYPDCVQCTDASPKPCSPCKQ